MAGAADHAGRRPAAAAWLRAGPDPRAPSGPLTPTASHRQPWALRWPAAAFAIALAAVAAGLQTVTWGVTTPYAAALPGALLAAGGAGWSVWAWQLMRRAATPTRLHATPLQLIEEGPFRIGRHPIYLGQVLMMAGLALALGWPWLLLAAAAYAGLLHRCHVPYEEARLAQRFGGWWRDYASRTRQWL